MQANGIENGWLQRLALLACICFACIPASAQDDLVVHLTFDEGSGPTAFDESANAYHGTLVQNPQWVPGLLGGGLKFDGVDDHVSLNVPEIPAPWTAAVWVRREFSGGSNSKIVYSPTSEILLEQWPSWNMNVGITRTTGTAGDFLSSFVYSAPIDGRWVHLAFVCNGSTTQLYVDGSLKSTLSKSMALSIQNLGGGGEGTLKGTLDDFRLYSRALGSTEVADLIPPLPPQIIKDRYFSVPSEEVFQATLPGVLNRAYDPNGDAITAQKESDPQHGTLSVNSNGQFSYTPFGGYRGLDSFTYSASDGTFTTAPATVYLILGGQISHYPFDEMTGTAVADLGALPNPGTLSDDTAWIPGIAAGALQLDAAHRVVTLEREIAQPQAVSFWVNRLAEISVEQTFGNFTSSPNFQSIGVNDLGKLYISDYLNADIKNYFNYTVPLNKWVHIAIVNPGLGPYRLYINGRYHSALTSGSGSSLPHITQFGSAVFPPHCQLDDIRIYGRTINEEDLRADFAPVGPMAKNDVLYTARDMPLNQPAPGVLVNDLDVNGDELNAEKLSDPTNGSVTLNADGSLQYTPHALFTGEDSFTYRVLAGGLYSEAVTVRIVVAPAGNTYTLGHWKFNEGVGSSSADSSGKGRTAILSSGATWGPSPEGFAASYPDTLGYVQVFSTPSLKPANAITFALWARMTQTRSGSGQHSDLMRNGSSSLGPFLRWSHADGRLQFRIDRVNAPDIYVFDTQLNAAYLNEWHHFAATYDSESGAAILYVDGQERAKATHLFGLLEYGSDNVFIGGTSTATNRTPGRIDDARLYGRALSALEILNLAHPPPVTQNDRYDLPGAPVHEIASYRGVLANDDDFNGGPIEAVKQSDPAHGTLDLRPDGSFTYTPEPGYEGPDAFTYVARDSDGDSAIATVTLNVNGFPLPAGKVKRLLHLGPSTGRMTGSPADGVDILWDYMIYSGEVAEERHQPSVGQHYPMRGLPSTTQMVWTDLTDADDDGDWHEDLGDNYVGYAALYLYAPTARDVRVLAHADRELQIFVDQNSNPLSAQGDLDTVIPLAAGWHSVLLKHHEDTGGDRFSLAFANPDGTDMTDLRFMLQDPLPPSVESFYCGDSPGHAPRWQDLIVSFSEPMDTSVAAGDVASITGGTVSGTWVWSDHRTLTFTPAGLWDSGATYTVTIQTPSARDRFGNALPASAAFQFSVTSALSTPTVIGVDLSGSWTGSSPDKIVLSGTGFQEGRIAYTAGAVPYAGRYYRYIKEGVSWTSARSQCASQGGHLVTLGDAAENEFVWRLNGRANGWIGLNDPTATETNVWDNGEAVGYTAWADGEPNSTSEQYVAYAHGLSWKDTTASSRPYVCEYVKRIPPQVELRMEGQPKIAATNERLIGAGSLEFDLNLAGCFPGTWDVVLINPDGVEALLPGGFEVTPPPVLHAAVPRAAAKGSVIELVIAGAHLPTWSGTGATSSVPARFGVRVSPGIFSTGTLTLTPTGLVCQVDLDWLFVGTHTIELLEGYTPGASTSMEIVEASHSIYGESGYALDGEFNLGSGLPSGDGEEGGDFVADFTVAAPAPRVLSLLPAPGPLGAPPQEVVAEFDEPLDADSAIAESILLQYAGDDEALGTADDVAVPLETLSLETPQRIRATFNPTVWARGKYRLRLLSGGLKDLDGNALDGENSGGGDSFPTGDGDAGGHAEFDFELNRAPATTADSYATDEDTALTGTSVLANDSDAHGGAPGESNTPITAELVDGPAHAAAFTLNEDGTFAYTPATDYQGSDGFTYRAVDALGAESNVTAVTITVGSLNDSPVTVADAYTTNEDTLLTGSSVLANDSDAHGGAPGESNTPLTAELVDGPVHAAAFTLNEDGTFTYTPAAEYNGSDVFSYRAVDALGSASSDTIVTLTVNGINDAPVTLADLYGTSEDTALTGTSVLANDSDAHGGAPGESNTPITAELVDSPAHAAAFTLNEDGTFAYTPATDYQGSDGFTYRAVDALGAESNVTAVTITVGNVNDLPKLTVMGGSDGPFGTDPGDPFAFVAEVADADAGDSHTWLWDFGDGQTSTEPNPEHIYAAPGVYRVTVVVTDEEGGQDVLELFVEVTGLIKHTGLLVSQTKYTLNFGKKTIAHPYVDSFTLSGKVNAQSLLDAGLNPEQLSGKQVEVDVGGASASLASPSSSSSTSVVWQSPRGAIPNLKVTYSPKTGAVSVALSGIDLAESLDALGAENAAGISNRLVMVPVALRIGGTGGWSSLALLGTRYTCSRVGSSGKGIFRLARPEHPIPGGLFFVTKAAVSQRSSKGVLEQRVQATVQFVPMAGAPFNPAGAGGAALRLGQYEEDVGDGSVGSTGFVILGEGLQQYLRPKTVALTGVSSLRWDAGRATLTIITNWLPATPGTGSFGIAPVLDSRSDPRVVSEFLIGIEADSSGGEQRVRLRRAGTSWKP
ncbi:MAG: tandem-95 repeat protein [Planctomycetes bacterium]|nr:tandem-95 repeat protein [Planctomycetota bacterium]